MPRFQVPLGATRTITIGTPTKGSLNTTMAGYGKNVNTGVEYSIGSTEGDDVGADVVLTLVFTAGNGLATGDEIAIQVNNGLDRFVPNDREPDQIIVEIIELLDGS